MLPAQGNQFSWKNLQLCKLAHTLTEGRCPGMKHFLRGHVDGQGLAAI